MAFATNITQIGICGLSHKICTMVSNVLFCCSYIKLCLLDSSYIFTNIPQGCFKEYGKRSNILEINYSLLISFTFIDEISLATQHNSVGFVE